uniref:Uncharacterized protein n=1 Tax=Anguilla anguilla TaxID=7936 RepID=A0A0E9PSG5_ANGAN
MFSRVVFFPHKCTRKLLAMSFVRAN